MHRFLHPRWHCPASQLAWQSSRAASVHSLSPQEEFTHNKPPSNKFLKFIRTTCDSEQVLLPNFYFVLGVSSNWSWQDCWTIVILCSVYMISAEGDHSKVLLGSVLEMPWWHIHSIPEQDFWMVPFTLGLWCFSTHMAASQTGSKLLQAWQFVLSVVPGKGSQCNLSPQHINIEC